MDTGLALNTDAQLAAAVVTAYALAQQGVKDPQQLSGALFSEIGTLTAEQRSFNEPPKGGKVGMTRPLNKIRPKLESFDDDKARKWTRFTYRALIALSQTIGIPDPYITSCRDRFSAVEALAILCNRLVFPSRLEDLANRWGHDYAQISRVTNKLAHFIDNEWAFLLADISRFTPNDLERFVSATIHARCPANVIAFFLDATFEEVTELTDDQRAMYSGYC